MFLPLLFCFTLLPALELYLLFKVGAQFGALNTILIIIGTGILGASLAKSQGTQLLIKVQTEINQGKLPASEMIQGFCVFGGGLLLLTPGFVTDILGFCMILPGPRSLMAFFVQKLLKKAVQNGNVQFNMFSNMNGFGQGPSQSQRFKDEDIFDTSYTKKPDQNTDENIIEVDFKKEDEKDI